VASVSERSYEKTLYVAITQRGPQELDWFTEKWVSLTIASARGGSLELTRVEPLRGRPIEEDIGTLFCRLVKLAREEKP